MRRRFNHTRQRASALHQGNNGASTDVPMTQVRQCMRPGATRQIDNTSPGESALAATTIFHISAKPVHCPRKIIAAKIPLSAYLRTNHEKSSRIL
jgi:hypothetical protein